MPLTNYLRPLMRWWRLIVIATALAVVASTISSFFQAENYVSRTTLVVGKTFLDPNPDSGQIIIAQHLAGIYADMALREPIQLAAMQALGISWLPQYHAEVVPNTQMVQISVTDTNPKRAQIIASELANQLILQSPTISGTETGERQDFIKQQLSNLQTQIQTSQKNIEELEKSLTGLNSASQIAKIQSQINEQLAKVESLQANYASFLSNSQEGAVNILTVLEPASLPTHSSGTNKFIIIALAGLVGLSLGCGTAYLLEYLDRSIKTTSDVERIFNLPVIGYIAEILEEVSKSTYIADNPNSVLAESFRLLHSNIEFFRISHPLKTILITSPGQGDGKSTVASNLALSISQNAQDVILVDADLRRPAVHKSFEMDQAPGLSDVISNRADLISVERSWQGDGGLKLITAGSKIPNITEVVGAKRISTILSDLKEIHDLIIIDAPPLIIADSYNLASEADGVIIVIEPGQTSDDQAKAIKEQLARANARIIGCVFNKVTEGNAQSYGDYQYQSLYSPKYYGDYVSGAKKESATVNQSEKLMDFFEHGKVPAGMAVEVQNAITAIKTQPRKMVSRIRKSKRNHKPSSEDVGAGHS
jgi:capsular exopolysaccharide synthesis family protein